MPNSTATPKQEFMEEHLPYEIGMLQGTYAQINVKIIETNALIESFAIHARAFLEFFEVKRSKGHRASDFTNAKYICKYVNKLNDSTIKKLDQQIAHMTAKRTKESAAKFNGKERADLLTAIGKEVAEFKKQLKPEFSKLFGAHGEATGVIAVTADPGATNAVTIVSA
jgi:hypothetical protein